jgi:SAM-dependent methyltransferase
MQNGFGCIDDLRDAKWDRLVASLGQRGLGSVEIDGWKRHWSRIWEFPWAYTAISANFSPATHPLVIESGCGVTPMPFWLGGDGFQVVGFDLDTSCEARWNRTGVPCRPDPSKTRFECGDMLHLPLADASVDIAYSVSAIEHTSDPVRAVAEMLRVLKPGGGLILTMDVDICGSDSVSWQAFSEIVSFLERHTRSLLPVRHVTPGRLLTFENRTLVPQSSTRLLSKRILDYLGIRARSDQTVFAWAGEKN